MKIFGFNKKQKTKKPKNQVLKPGTMLGRYTISRRLSSGGFGVVYLAVRDDGYQVAIKEFLPSVISCRPMGSINIKCKSEYDMVRFNEGLKAFFREADMLAHVHNPRIIPVWDVFKKNGTAYFTMPVEKGDTLQSFIRLQKYKISEEELRSLFVDACKGVEALHDQGVLHLDIKPNNLWVRPDRSVLVLDLGASRWEDEEMKSSQMARTPGFAAPEQHGNSKNRVLSVKTDVYGMCASMLSCLNHAPPPPANTRKVGDKALTWSQYGRVSSDLLEILEKGMSMSSNLRYKDIKSLRLELENIPRLLPSPRWKDKLDDDKWISDSQIDNLIY